MSFKKIVNNIINEGLLGKNKYYQLDLVHSSEMNAEKMLSGAGFDKRGKEWYNSDSKETAEIKTHNGKWGVSFYDKSGKVMASPVYESATEILQKDKGRKVIKIYQKDFPTIWSYIKKAAEFYSGEKVFDSISGVQTHFKKVIDLAKKEYESDLKEMPELKKMFPDGEKEIKTLKSLVK